MKNFKVGQIVVCVNPVDYLVKDMLYTVKEVYPNGIQLRECANPIGDFIGYSQSRFVTAKINWELDWEDVHLLSLALDCISDDSVAGALIKPVKDKFIELYSDELP